MKTKNIIKALALAMLLTTACVNNEIPNENGYALPVTVNVTRQGNDPATRATYTDNGDGTGSLAFSTGDQLFVYGSQLEVGTFQGTLTWQSGGTFSGTLTTENSYGGTAQALLESADFAGARLLPADYDDYDYFYFNVYGFLDTDYTKAFAPTKATAVAQFSLEEAKSYSDGFALAPSNTILNFTISGLTPGSHNVVVFGRSGAVTANVSGVATFAVGVDGDTYSENINLKVDDDYFDLNLFGGTDTPLDAGKIYNIYRDVTATRVDLSTESGYYEVTGDVILTGTPAATLTIVNDGGYTVTLDNVNPAGTATVGMNCGSDFTLKLKGTSKFTSIFDIGYALTISEAVAGGTVIINNSTGYALMAATVTVNGGTVKAKAQNNAVNGNLAVNGGAVYLEGGNSVYIAVTGAISGSATLYGWNGSAWDAATGVQYVTTDNSAAPSTWTW